MYFIIGRRIKCAMQEDEELNKQAVFQTVQNLRWHILWFAACQLAYN